MIGEGWKKKSRVESGKRNRAEVHRTDSIVPWWSGDLPLLEYYFLVWWGGSFAYIHSLTKVSVYSLERAFVFS